MLQDRIDAIIADLGDSNDQLLAVLDDLWLEIDHTDSESVKTGSQRMIGVINAVKNYQSLCDELTSRLHEFLPNVTSTKVIEIDHPNANEKGDIFSGYKIISLTEEWRYLKPQGFIFRGEPVPWKRNWIDLYQSLCEVLHNVNPEKFYTIPDQPEIISSQKKPYFSRNQDPLRTSIKIGDSIFAESNLSAKLIRDNIRRLLRILDIPETALTIYIRN
jgi:hypothetical protein